MKLNRSFESNSAASGTFTSVGNPVTCPWCGTIEYEIRSNCRNCGGPLPPRRTDGDSLMDELPARPPSPPRDISNAYVRKLMMRSGWAVTAFVLAILGITFGIVGLILTAFIVTAFVGIPFLGMGAIFAVFGVVMLSRQYEAARTTVEVLRNGIEAEGVVTGVEQNMMVRINGRNPFVITYEYSAEGRRCTGTVSTLQDPSQRYAPGRKAWVLYTPGSPETSALYPHP